MSSIVPLRREPTTPCFILDSGTVVAGSNQAWSCSASTFWPDLYIILAKVDFILTVHHRYYHQYAHCNRILLLLKYLKILTTRYIHLILRQKFSNSAFFVFLCLLQSPKVLVMILKNEMGGKNFISMLLRFITNLFRSHEKHCIRSQTFWVLWREKVLR